MEYGQRSDTELIDACRSGDSGAWDTLVDRYQRLVYTIPTRYGLNASEVDDVFQSVWLALLRNLGGLREPDRVAAWLVTTARRECWERRRGADFSRTMSVGEDSVLSDHEAVEPTPEEVLIVYRQHENLRQAIEQLDDTCQELLWHLYYDESGPSYSEIAQEMDMPIGSIGPKRARCISKLREIMGEWEPE